MILLPKNDFIAWLDKRNGLFLIMSVYKLTLGDQMCSNDLGQYIATGDGDRTKWNLIWKANVPRKVRVLV